MTQPDSATLRATLALTWPPVRSWPCGPFTLRDGGGGGGRVSSATLDGEGFTADDIAEAEAQMRAIGQAPSFMMRSGDDGLDEALRTRGYAIKDPVALYLIATEALAKRAIPPLSAVEAWPPVASQRTIWESGGVGQARLAIMERAGNPKVTLLGRAGNRPAATAFVACAGEVAMLHALETAPPARRRGAGERLVIASARWGARHGARWLALFVTHANAPADALYVKLGMRIVDGYHYRILQDPAP